MKVEGRDCSQLTTQPNQAATPWLRSLAADLNSARNVLSFGKRDDDEPVVYCERDGTWWAGRYVGILRHGDHSLSIEPRFGMATLASWLTGSLDPVLVTTPGRLRKDVPFIVQLLAFVWGRAFADAARHGLPALRQDRQHAGTVIRGQLDVRRTLNERFANREVAVSVIREKSLDNPIGQTLVAAYRVLRRLMGPGPEGFWLPERVVELLPRLTGAVGRNPMPPTDGELRRVRYTPITARFARVVQLSQMILRHKGLLSQSEPTGETEGILLDVAELWELFVLGALRKAGLALDVSHGTSQEEGRQSLLKSEVDGTQLGELRPDAVLSRNGCVIGIVDAKYKRLRPSPWNSSGVQREDLYQLTAYLSRYSSAEYGVLAYPEDPNEAGQAFAEKKSWWKLESGQRVGFITLPHDIEGAAEKLRQVLSGSHRSDGT